jgi:type IV pilus assembly protein PilY1
MKRVLGLGLFLTLVSGLILAGAGINTAADGAKSDDYTSDGETSNGETSDGGKSDAAASMCFDYPPQARMAQPYATGAVPDQSLVSFQRGTDHGYLFQAEHDPSNWSGSLKKFSVTLDAAGQVVPKALLWDGGALLAGMPASLRKIFTLRPELDQPHGTVPFTWAMLSQQQRSVLDLSPETGLSDALGQRRLDFLRGDRSFEIGQPGGIFRRRVSVMGDAIHAAPLLVGAPSPGIAGAQYATFFARHAQRPAAIYLGANDGMLHAFDALGGRELFAYVPNLLLPSLNQLSSPNYRHRPYVDGTIRAAEAIVGGQWKTVLIAGLGGGADGVLALDISAPDQFDQGGGALWEFGRLDDAAIGHVVDAPLIAMFRMTAQRGVPSQRHFAVLSGGLDHPGRGALFLLALDQSDKSTKSTKSAKPAAARWRLGTDYYKLMPPATDAVAGAALGAPALVFDADGAVRTAYAGDGQGNLWRFDFSATSPAGAAVQLLFVARDAHGVRQPITQRPNVVFASGGGYLVLFGTGKLNQTSDNDPASFKPQSFYAIHDPAHPSGAPGKPGAPDRALVSGRAALARRTLTAVPDRAADPVDASQGWYLDFSASSGERSVDAASLAGGKVFFNTVVPGSAPCTVAATRSYAVDALTGLADGRSRAVLTRPVSNWQAPPHGAPMVLETATEIGPRSATGRALVRQHYAVLASGNTGIAQTATSDVPAQRLSWREIANWPQLHQATK